MNEKEIIKKLAEEYGVTEKVVIDLMNENFNFEEIEEILEAAEW